MLKNLNDVLRDAKDKCYAVPAFDCVEDIMIRCILDTSEEEKSPVILMALEHNLKGRSMDYISGFIKFAAELYRIPVVLHLDHATNLDLIESAIDHGFTSVMYDGSSLPFDDNVKITRDVVEMAHRKGVSVEAELGHVGGFTIDGKSEESKLTDPDEVVKFVSETNVDALAVSIGTTHGVYISEPNLNIKRLSEIRERCSVPLVLHGGSGTPVEQVQNAVKHGITKVNLYADLRIAMNNGLKEAASKIKRIDPYPDEMFAPMKKLLSNVIRDKIRMLNSNNRIEYIK
ncbi:class II fructose-bisphosphate aldolase [Thermoanaerobacterium thermosaccharolyticum]|uniref:Ketose-bisphosphate aldolase n=1 Tax=Thermoanaerobacterium thermosaccharolyticum (strain ATCC 7956 / DSM 571 / NCIMB 9385 / NCA 3814 / NCTC 13789 / WDCM 00135 / 2032) TaxID=580327 RepID=D9TQJ2_THETC|nr:class II fructose-bisphosphate aldolase [Thermoanaerobacterium thermosaccharolyticum]ADL69226.1 ketose-bisphosphate aldolase [Thermoanaerobacterium thermosaccharolyticum DSM 571]MBE0068684.1 class II fructose-bisphosphate aldolase [Thermoanaerobacterium thermosaccharolyticum]MBE0228272.1 class II fructose-bisphosphate aldolase [Thermoanaerobacterium thermosaccharolyticum]TCW31993.1 fructose-bisphosphate aldolase class II [Thermohydrogenium kirishiense]